MKYHVSVGSTNIVVEIDGASILVDGEPVSAQLLSQTDSPELRLVVDGASHRLALDGEQGGVWRLVDRGAVHEVTVEDERRRHIRLLAGPARVADGSAAVKAPMPGLVVRVLVAVGDRVDAGTPLLALEAMKMENEIKATAPALVRAVRVAPGQAVEKGQVLLELESPAR